MSTTVGERRQLTLPSDVFEAAQLKAGDALEWRFENGEIRGRKIAQAVEPRLVRARLALVGGALVLQADGIKIDPAGIAQAVREEREQA